MVETYKYKSKIATVIAFAATIIAFLGKDGLAHIIPAEYTWLIPTLIGLASYVLAQKTEDTRVDVAEQMVLEKIGNQNPIDDIDPCNDYEELNDIMVGDDDGGA